MPILSNPDSRQQRTIKAEKRTNQPAFVLLLTRKLYRQRSRSIYCLSQGGGHYATGARKVEKLRQKIGLSVPAVEQKQVKEDLLAEMPSDFLSQLAENQRQAVALPFWGIAGLGLLLGIAFQQPLDFLAPAIAFPIAFQIQKWGWRLQAKRLVIRTLEDIEAGMKKTNIDVK